MTKDGDEGVCGINKQATYPVVNTSAPPHPVPRPTYPYSYGDPSIGNCAKGNDLLNATVGGIKGALCSPPCKHGMFRERCDNSGPPATNARPECVLNVAGGDHPDHCALVCDTTADAIRCPELATCVPYNSTHGICSYLQ